MDIIKIMIAAGGTGGHLFPAVAVAEQLQRITNDSCEFHFIGTSGKIEARVVPALGHRLHTIKLSGITKSLKTLAVPFQVIGATVKCTRIIKEQKISAVIAAGAYLSYPPGIAASMEKIPLILMESNVNPGKSIKMLSKKATRIVTAFDESKEYFLSNVQEKIICLGNPVRGDILNPPTKEEARSILNIPQNKKLIFIFGGSLGARSINQAVASNIDNLDKMGIDIIWQTGRNYPATANLPKSISQMQFVDNMALYYAAADLVVARSGATTVAELCIAGKPSVLVPLPSASNNEQAHNAKILQNNNAAITVLDNEIENKLIDIINQLINDDDKMLLMGLNAKKLAKPNAAFETAKEVLKIIEQKRNGK